MNRPVRIAIVKPDYGVSGGFEALLDRLGNGLEQADYDVAQVTVPGRQLPRPIWGQSDAASRWFEHPDYFNYLAMVHDTRRLDLDDFDLVISTQPPSYLAPHDRMLGLFYHQARIFYELSPLYIDAGFVDRALHEAATEHVRSIDRAHLDGVTRWLAGSHECAGRLTEFWDIDRPISFLDAPPLTQVSDRLPNWSGAGPVVCVSRHEWPKRTELVVAAGHLLKHRTVLQGGGGRQAHIEDLNRRFTDGSLDPAGNLDSELGRIKDAPGRTVGGTIRARLNRSTGSSTGTSNDVQILGRVSDAERNQAYADASVVVAPAYREDYGLTAIEAMAWGNPVVVCRDGGGLVETIEATGAGLVVEPNASAIATGIRSILDDPALGRELSERAVEVQSTYTWERATAQMLDAVSRSLETP